MGAAPAPPPPEARRRAPETGGADAGPSDRAARPIAQPIPGRAPLRQSAAAHGLPSQTFPPTPEGRARLPAGSAGTDETQRPSLPPRLRRMPRARRTAAGPG